MAKALTFSICVLLVCAGAASGRVDVYGWLNASGEVRVESWFTMDQYALHRWLAVDGGVSDYGYWSYEDWDGAWATQRHFTASGAVDSLCEVIAAEDSGTGSLYLRAGSLLVGEGDVSVIDGTARSDAWIRGWVDISGVAAPSMTFRTFLAGSGVNAPTDTYASAWAKCVGESALAENLIEFWVSQGESPVLDAGWDVTISNEAFTIWGNPYIGTSSW